MLSVIVPARNEELTLPHTLPHILAAADQARAQVLVVVPEGTSFHTALPVPRGRVEWITTDTVGKFPALRDGVARAAGDRLLFCDADVVPEPHAFAALDAALDRGADVAAGQIALSTDPRHRGPAVLRRWSAITFATWHDLRTEHPELRWALPGALYALHSNYFPAADPLVPVLDDASVGLSARDRGAVIDYVPSARVLVTAPASTGQWMRQKVRTQQGWTRLRALRLADATALESALAEYRARHIGSDPVGMLLPVQDRVLGLLARRRGAEAAGAWRPERTEWAEVG
ncbi:glycosyltransferase [Lentzea sp. JNUCC 0626]|uniref:glycosyltransferase n=1 Tax=Lentzea sp. JNUCC 0626 TaxID=3367513 RepID=UPI003747E2EB